jgi:hypothetical protein
MKKRLALKKVTLRNLDDVVLDRLAGGATGVTECGQTCPGVCATPNCTQNTICTWDGCTLGCQAQSQGGCQTNGTCASHCVCASDPGLTCANTCAASCGGTCTQPCSLPGQICT